MYLIDVWHHEESKKGFEWLFEYESDAIDQIYSNVKNYIDLFLDVRTPFKLKKSSTNLIDDTTFNITRYNVSTIWEKNNIAMVHNYSTVRLSWENSKAALKEAEEKQHKLELYVLNGLLRSRFENIKFKTVPQNIEETKKLLDLFYNSIERVNMNGIMFNVPLRYEIEDLTNIAKVNESIPRLV